MAFMFGNLGVGGGGHGYNYRNNSTFESYFQCYSSIFAGRSNIDDGDKILLPPSALEQLARMNVDYPMLFELTNEIINKKTHCGVLEFSAEEGKCYLPFWMMENLLIEEGGLIKVKNVALSKATFVKFRARNVDFLEISNHRAVLEVTLRKFTCLTKDDIICIQHSDKNYYLDVREVQPNNAASIIETDCNVDFEEPLGYQDSEYGKRERSWSENNNSHGAASSSSNTSGGSINTRVLQKAKADEPVDDKKFVPFAGSGQRIDGRTPTKGSSSSVSDTEISRLARTAAASAALARSSVSISASASVTSASAAATSASTITYESRIGDKYSKKKTAASAFSGSAHSLK